MWRNKTKTFGGVRNSSLLSQARPSGHLAGGYVASQPLRIPRRMWGVDMDLSNTEHSSAQIPAPSS